MPHPDYLQQGHADNAASVCPSCSSLCRMPTTTGAIINKLDLQAASGHAQRDGNERSNTAALRPAHPY
jgi:hypothetical protein